MNRRLGGESNWEIGFVSFVRACVPYECGARCGAPDLTKPRKALLKSFSGSFQSPFFWYFGYIFLQVLRLIGRKSIQKSSKIISKLMRLTPRQLQTTPPPNPR